MSKIYILHLLKTKENRSKVRGAFSSRELAQKYAEKSFDSNDRLWTIQELEVDSLLPNYMKEE